MNLKRLLSVVLPVTVALLAAYLGLLVGIRRHYEKPDAASAVSVMGLSPEDVDPERLSQELKNFVYRKIVEGKEEYRIEAKTGYEYRGGNVELRDHVLLALHQKDGTEVEIRGDWALYRAGNESILMKDGVTVTQSEGWTMRSPWLRYEPERHRAVAGQEVTITKKTMTITGRRLFYDNRTEEIRLVGDVRAEVHREGREPTIVRADELDAHKKRDLALLKGDVSVFQFPDELRCAALDLHFTPGPRKLENALARGKDPQTPAVLSSPIDPNHSSRGVRRLIGSSVEVSFEVPGGPVSEIIARDQAGSWLRWEPEVRGDGREWSLKALEIRLFPDAETRSIARIHAQDQVEVWSSDADGEQMEKTMESDVAQARIEPTSHELDWLEMTGNFRGRDMGWDAQAGTMEYRLPGKLVNLKSGPVLSNKDWRLEAPEIILDRDEKSVQAAGGVRSEILADEMAFLGEGGNNGRTYVLADAMTYDDGTGTARYAGSPAILIKGKNRVEGKVITFNSANRTLDAQGGVETHLVAPAATTANDGKDDKSVPWVIRSQALRWDAAKRILDTTGAATLDGGGFNIEGERIWFELDGASKIERILSESDEVRVQHNATRGRSERFEYDLKDRIIRLFGYTRDAVYIDEKGASHAGNLLTLQANNDRMGIISSEDGRAKTSPRGE